MGKPSSFIGSFGRRVLLVLGLAFLVVVGLSGVAPSQESDAGRNRIAHQMVLNYIQIGTKQYGRGDFEEAKKTFILADGFQQYLTAVERQQLKDALAKTRAAIKERKRIVETYQTVIELLRQEKLAEAKTNLEKIKDSEFLTKKEKEQIAEALRQIDAQIGGVEPIAEKVVEEKELVETEPNKVNPNIAPEEKEAAEKQIVDLYNSSVKLYRAGELEKAREGFVKVMESDLIPAEVAKVLKSYVERIDKTLAGKAKPSAGKEGVDKRKQTAELYKQSVELYNKGEFDKAREGFIRVAQSGLLTAAGEKNVSDYLQRIEKLSSERAAPKAKKAARAAAEPEEVVPEIGQTQTGEEAYIDVVNRKRNIVRSHTRAVVNDAIDKARSFMEKGEFDKAKEVAANAEVIVSTNQMHLGEELFKQCTSTLAELKEQIDKAENEKAQKDEEEKRTAAAESQRKFKEQMEVDREKRKAELMKNALAYQQRENYEAARGQLESLLALDPQNKEALVLKRTLEDMIDFKKQSDVKKEKDKERADVLLKTEEAGIPYAEEYPTYPKNWVEITQKRRPEEAILNPAVAAVYEQLSRVVDLSGLKPQMPLSEAIDMIKNAVQPPLQIQPLWLDLESVDIQRTTPINMDGLPSVRLGDALDQLLMAVAGRPGRLDYAV